MCGIFRKKHANTLIFPDNP